MNFDNKTLYSAYREMANYEFYASNGWNSEYREFLDLIPLEKQYWINDENEGFLM